MAVYSNLFSSGLLAPNQGLYPSRTHTPVPPSSPMLMPTTPGDPIDRYLTPTPTQQNSSSNAMHISPGPSGSNFNTHTNIQTNPTEPPRPRLRKRRSSLSVTVNPMGNIKSPGRSAGHALQRTGLLSPSRMGGFASEETSLAGRMGVGLRLVVLFFFFFCGGEFLFLFWLVDPDV